MNMHTQMKFMNIIRNFVNIIKNSPQISAIL